MELISVRQSLELFELVLNARSQQFAIVAVHIEVVFHDDAKSRSLHRLMHVGNVDKGFLHELVAERQAELY